MLLGVIDFRQQRHLAEEEFIKRGEAMAANLAQGSKLAVFTENEFLLESAVKSVALGADYAYVLIYGEDWKIHANPEKQVTDMKGLIQELSDGEKDQLLRQRQGFFKRITGKKGRFVEFLAPIIAKETQTLHELQVGPLGSGAGDTDQAQQRTIGTVRLGLSLKNVDSHLAALLKWRAGLIVVFLYLSTLVIYVFSRRITRPIKHLTDQATQIGDGYLDQVIPVDSQDEIGQLAITFNDMARSLKGNITEKELALAKFRELNQTLEDRILQRTAQLEDATRHKSQFLANVNHELRTPLSAVLGYGELLLRKTEGQIDAAQTENIHKLLNTTERLLNLINSLLDLAKIEAGRMEFCAEPIKVPELINDIAGTIAPMLEGRNVDVVREIATGVPILNTDPEKLRQIILNLLSNAVKFTERGEIKVSALQENGSLKLVVSDTGIGIKKEELENIFEEFHRSNLPGTRKYEGSGLGLAIVKKLVQFLGGDVSVESEVGKGSVFTVTLPLKPRIDTSS
jgi:signal transduction histidine kinase